ncbi:unnamed protein product (macronuclear) [Paramecium tetraurelia]|uniref:Rab-GAP TBC domain-containing protein n=1 Tax=Paramecium tetraurelia TaxID=5888 RepID=A0C6A4_PARTE|nr:uncharacterized protein GSPATT00035450001 [Paramecium tetraurelia]CAK66321.1 unnamed protein product [Paramecium tetraurelia]|eukprot:XP_001433718.1 hypothetical protein (macronuclear) [Paramecium tetraurelia strain d4-2]
MQVIGVRMNTWNAQLHLILSIYQRMYRKLPRKLQEQTLFSMSFEAILTNSADEFQSINKDIFMHLESKESDFYNLLISAFLKYYPEIHYSQMLNVLTYVFKGISIEEIVLICNCEKQHFLIIYEFFKVFLMEKQQIYCIFSLVFKNVLSGYFPHNKTLFQSFIMVIEHSLNSIRKLEELIYQYSKGKRYFKLKEVLINIESFLLYCTPYHKFELCHLWQTLEQNGYDLVMEYNKAVDNFQAFYKPTNEGLFYIILQISRFLREYSIFENDHTPPYKHPQLRGQSIDFDEIGLYNELKELKMIAKKKKKIMNEEYFASQITNIDTLNMDIKANRDYFINYYMSQFDQGLVQEYINTKQENVLDKIIRNTRNQQFYYYKRWVWVQFPWLSLTQKNNYSKLMEQYSINNMPLQDELQLNQKAIKLAQIAKQTQQMKEHNTSKLPSINSSIRLRRYSPLEISRITNIPKTRADSEHTKSTERSVKKCTLPSIQKMQYQKKLDQIVYQNQVLKNRLKEYKTIRQNLYPDELSAETQKALETTKKQSEELKKQQENLQVIQQEMKRINIIWKLCQQNQDCNDRAQQLVQHSKNLDRLIQEQVIWVKDCNEKLGEIKLKQKIELKKQQVEKKQQQQQQQQQSQRRFTFIQNMPTSAGILSNIDTSYIQDTNKKQLQISSSLINETSDTRIKFVRLKTGKVEDPLDSHTQELVSQLLDLGIENLNKNKSKVIEFCDMITKNDELQLEIQNREQRLMQLRNSKQELMIFVKILQTQKKPKTTTSSDQYYSSYQQDDVIRQNDYKIQNLKQLQQHLAVIKFYNNNLHQLFQSIQKTDHNISQITQLLQKMI